MLQLQRNLRTPAVRFSESHLFSRAQDGNDRSQQLKGCDHPRIIFLAAILRDFCYMFSAPLVFK